VNPSDRGDPFHVGERLVQDLTGTRAKADKLAVLFDVRPSPTTQVFLASVRTVVLGGADDEQRCWATLLTGAPGFVHYAAPVVIIAALPGRADPLRRCRPGDLVGMLAIDMPRRHRFRINGRVRRWGPESLDIAVERVYGNCAKYINTGALRDPPLGSRQVTGQGEELTAAQQGWIRGARTLFIASMNPGQGADASHRGGPAGFVRVEGPRLLIIPDYPGNNMFNTLGNIVVNPAVGLLFFSGEGESVLQVSGRAILTDDFGGIADLTSERQLRVGIDRVVESSVT
jgi:predicted pyridoxine 5'-phosphate oxidase superfamily flavin-nucleotide-binding protein